MTGNNGIDAELKIDSESNNLGFSIRSNNTDAVSFYSENKDQGTFMKFDSYANQVHIGSGTSINKTIINTESLDLSNQETAMELKSNKFYALEITNGPRETDSYLRVDTDNNEIVLGEGSNVNRLKFQSEFLDTSNQDTKIYIGHNSTSALNFVDVPASKSSFLKMGIDTITIGEGGGIDRTIISTNTLDITNVSIVELNALDIIDQNSNQRYIKMRNKEVIIGDDMAENSNFIRVKNDDVNMHSINTIGLNAVNSISIAAQNDINITSEKTVEIDGIALSNGNLKTNGNITVEAGDMVFTGSKTSTILHQSEGGNEDGLKIASVNGHVKVENIIFNKNNISGLSHLFIKGNDDPNLPVNTNNNNDLLSIRGVDDTNFLNVHKNGTLRVSTIAGGVNIKGGAAETDMLAFTDGEGVEQRSGKIININTASKYIENPISLNAPSMTGGKGMRISTPSITSGSALQITTMGGNNMKGSLDPVPVKIWKDGTVTVYNKGAKHNLTNGEFINLSNCTMEDNNGEFIITLLEDTTRRLTCTNMEYYDYLIEGYVNNNTVVAKVDEMSTVI